MKLRGASWAWVLGLALGVGIGCTKANPHYCSGDAGGHYHECPEKDAGTDSASDLASDRADATDAGDVADGGEVGDAVDAADVMDLVPEKPMCSVSSCLDDTAPICDVDAGVCHKCTTGAECKARNSTEPGCDNGTCFPCATNAECTVDATRPICDTHACRPCKSDTECAGPVVCQEDGSCAAEGSVVHLDVSAATCTGGQDGTAAKPFCDAAMAVAALSATRDVLIVHGPNAGLTVSNTLPSVLIIGKKNAGGESASLSVGVGSGLTVTAGNVLIRDISVVGGTASGSKGIVASGTAAKVSLLRVNVSIGTGLGVQADTGAVLTMNRSVSQGNSTAGLLINGASAKVTNSVFANNGTGVKFNVPLTSTFWSNTIIGSTGNAATCDPNNMQPLLGSIVVGVVDTCIVDHGLVTAPTFDGARPFHLTAKTACTGGNPPMYPLDDIDGDIRALPIDCGADQYVAAH
jgi:hypothetical protein